MKRIISLLLCLVLVLNFAACTKEEPSNADNTLSPVQSPDAKDGKDDASATGKKTIYVIVKLLDNQYWSVVQAGAEKAGKDLDCNVVIVGTQAESDIDKQIDLVKEATDAKADGIVIGPLDKTSLAAPLAEPFKAGVPVVLIDSIVDGEDYSCALLTDNEEAGRMAATEMLKKLKEKGVAEDKEGTVAIQIGAQGNQAIVDRLRGFNAHWSENAPEAWTVLNGDIKVNDADLDKAKEFCKEFLDQHDDLIAVFGPNNGSTIGFVNGLTEAGRNDVTMVGFDFSSEIEEMIRGGEYSVSSVVQRQYYMGYDGVKKALELANGESVSEKTIDTGVLLVDSGNVDSEEVQSVINPQ